jgi:formylglycine-generating enzyme required for sulfatase activity
MNKKRMIKTVFTLFLLAMPLRSVADDHLIGDCNGDGKLSVSDVTTLISWLLSGYTPEQNEDKVFAVNGVTFKMIAVEGGTFMMGATEEQVLAGAQSNEYPAHQVTLSSFYVSQTEVTQELWQAVMGNNPSYFKGANKPVEQVSWDDCQEFICKLNNLTNAHFRLLTEAEWEYAARSGKQNQGYKYAGSNILSSVAWYNDNSSSETHPVGQKQPNELGLYDMSGNVCEWCQDWFGNYSSSSQTNPTGPNSGSNRVNRGGSWSLIAGLCRSSHRNNCTPSYRNSDLGFRLAL